MKDYFANLKEISKKHKPVFAMMIILFLLSVGLLVFSLVNLKPASTTVRTGYSDIGSYQGEEWNEVRSSSGYESGKWMDMLTYPVIAIILGLMHNIIALKLYKRRGSNFVMAFLAMSIMVVIGAFFVLARLVGEG